jgi:peptidoglycan/xylan/chitin deacetylase (PgdA/CDA1 family)
LSAKSFLRSALIGAVAHVRLNELALGVRRWRAGHGGAQRMLVIETHETPTRDQANFRAQLEWVAQRYAPVDLPTFARLWQEAREGAPPRPKPPVLFTFDDGRLSNYTIAAPLLESFGARGVFFVIPQWAMYRGQEAREFYYSRIDFQEPPSHHTKEDWSPMNPEHLADLAQRGHSVGNHTFSHVRLAGLPAAELHHEIVESNAQLAKWTGRPVDAFAWTFSWDSISPEAWDLIRQHHRFCFAPCPGMVDCSTDSPQLIWRSEVEARYRPAEFRFMYSGLVDLLWRKQRDHLRTLLR